MPDSSIGRTGTLLDRAICHPQLTNQTNCLKLKKMNYVIEVLSSIEGWFNRKWGWFFTNGSKHRP